jgi:predicted NBD/HSP70 family sugar kinase
MEWPELAEHLEVSVSTCHQVAANKKNLGDLALFRLEKAEVAAGLLPNDDAETSSQEARKIIHRTAAPDEKARPIKNLTISELDVAIDNLQATISRLQRLRNSIRETTG